MKRTSRKPSNLSESLQRHLNVYALAAIAAGVGTAQAKVIYTKTDKRIPAGGYHLTLNKNGVPDFTIYWNFNGYGYMLIEPSKKEHSNMVVGGALYSNRSHHKFDSYAAYALSSGASVGESAKLQPKHSVMYERIFSCTPNGSVCTVGQWFRTGSKYLGLMFHIKGAVHYGWARISWYPNHSSCGNQVFKGGCYKVTGYAYESVAGQSIMTGQTEDDVRPEPSSLGALAAGVAGRNERK
jgi:hypothetical protein